MSDRQARWIFLGIATSVPLALLAILIFLGKASLPAFERFGFGFFTGTTWDQVNETFGALPVIYGTLVSSLLALLFSAPVSITAALFLTEIAPKKISQTVGFLIEMLAAIPSVVYGLWGIFVLVPFNRDVIEPWLLNHFGSLPVVGALFSGAPFGVGILAAGMILAIMIAPTITSIAREVFRSIPRLEKEAALALGATRFEMIRIAVIKSSKSGLVGAISLGLARALGETMAVTMLIGNRAQITASLFEPGQTMASVLANEYAEAMNPLHVSSLLAVGFTLFIVTLIMNFFTRLLVGKQKGQRP